MATHSSILAWRIPWTEEPGGLQSTGSQSRAWLSDWARAARHRPVCVLVFICFVSPTMGERSVEAGALLTALLLLPDRPLGTENAQRHSRREGEEGRAGGGRPAEHHGLA